MLSIIHQSITKLLLIGLVCSVLNYKYLLAKDKNELIPYIDSITSLPVETFAPTDSLLLFNVLQLSDSLDYPKGSAAAGYLLSSYFMNQSNHPRALFYALKSIDECKKTDNFQLMIKGFMLVANVYAVEENIPQSQDYLYLATQYASMHDPSQLAACYNAMGHNACMTGQFDKAEEYFIKAIESSKNPENSFGLGKAYTNMNLLYRRKGDFKKALEYGLMAEKYYTKIPYQRGVLVNLTGMGICYSKLGNKDKAIECHSKVLKLARENNDVESIGNAYYGFYLVYKEFGLYKEALLWNERLQYLQDSVINKQNQDRIAELTRKYTNIKQESEIALLKKEKQIQSLEIQKTRWSLLFVIVLFLALSTIGILVFIFKQNRNKSLLRESVLKAELSERKRIARDLHDNIGSHLAYLVGGLEQAARDHQNEKLNQLEHFGRDAITQLRETIWAIQSNNTEILSFVDRVREMARRYHHHLHVEFINKIPFTATHKLSALQTLYLFRIIQESVSNAYKHSSAKVLLLEVSIQSESLFTILISDNGKGFDITKATVGNGLKNMEQRAFEIGASFRIISSPGNGTTIKIECPVTQF
jgi:signal transduction histidine kinase